MEDKIEKRGAKRHFQTEDSFKDKFDDYMDFCTKNKRLANIAGFAVFSNISRDTFYETKKFYPEAYNKIENVLEDYTLNADIYHTLKIFYLKCKFGYKDGREVDNNVSRVNIIDDLPDKDNE